MKFNRSLNQRPITYSRKAVILKFNTSNIVSSPLKKGCLHHKFNTNGFSTPHKEGGSVDNGV